MSEKKRFDTHSGDLSDRQSTRTTFRFSKEALEALGWLSERYEVPVKDVLHFALAAFHSSELINQDLEQGEEIKKVRLRNVDEKTIRRTAVVTKKTLIILNKLSKQYNFTRDDLINRAIIFTKMITFSTDASTIKVYREAFNLIEKFYLEANDVESKLRELLGDDNLIVNEFELSVAGILGPYIILKKEINKIEKS